MAALVIIAARQLRRERVFRDRNNALDIYTDIELISRYRFPRHMILELVDLVREDIERPTSRNNSLPVVIQVLTTLRFLGKGEYQSETGDIHGICKSSVSKCIKDVCNSLCIRLNNIKFPTAVNDIRKMKEKFHAIHGFPNVIGAVDGTLIPIQGMAGDDEQLFVCRKGYHALNIQAVSDASLRFINIVCGFPGSTHDAYILGNSGLQQEIENLPESGWLLGDSGYPLKTWLMTPLLHPTTAQEQRYNNAHCKSRTVVERAFGVLKSRFRCIHLTGGSLPYRPAKCAKIIETTFRLHNKAIDEKVPLMDGGNVVHHHHDNVHQDVRYGAAHDIRRQIMNRF